MTLSDGADRSGDDTFTARDRTQSEAIEISAWGEHLERLGHLYRYTALASERMTWFTKLVLESEIYFTPFDELNDPFDGRVRPIMDDASEQQIRDFWLGLFAEQGKTPGPDDLAQIEHHVAHARDPEVIARAWVIHDDEMSKLGVTCFSELRDDLPMWAYYADAHRGVCMRFRASLMLGWGGLPPMPVRYAIDRPSFYLDTRFKRMRAMVATKAPVWSHEREWRMVHSPGKMNFDPAALDGVIMGCRITPEVERVVREVLAKRHAKLDLLRARPSGHEFKLDIEPA